MDTTGVETAFDCVSDDILLSIFSFLGFRDWLTLDLVCKRFHRITSSDKLWRDLLNDFCGEDPQIWIEKAVEWIDPQILEKFKGNSSSKELFLSARKSELERAKNIAKRINSRECYQRVCNLVVDHVDCKFLAYRSRPILLKEPSLITLEVPVVFFGGIRGHLRDLQRWIKSYNILDQALSGYVSKRKFLFLGHMINRGWENVETLCLLLALKILLPENVYLFRSKEEHAIPTQLGGFYDEISVTFEEQNTLYSKFLACFHCLPIACLVKAPNLTLYGSGIGLIPEMMDAEDINKRFLRPLQPRTSEENQDLFVRIEYSKFSSDAKDYEEYESDIMSEGYFTHAFGKSLVENGIDIMVTGFHYVETGYQEFLDGKFRVLTGSTNFKGRCMNCAAAMEVDEEGQIHYKIKKPKPVET